MMEKHSEQFKKVLGLKGSPVAVSYRPVEGVQQLGGKKSVCQLIQKARRGESFFVTGKNMLCPGGGYYLGIAPKMPRHEDFLADMERIFSSVEVAKKFFECMPAPPSAMGKSVYVTPLEKADAPDVVLFVCNAFQAARLIGLYTFDTGISPKNYIFGAACQAAISVPLVTNEMCVSFIDTTARLLGGYKEDELIVGVPYGRLGRMAESMDKSLWGTAEPRYRIEDLLGMLR